MNRPWRLWTILAGGHLGVGALSAVLRVDRLSALVAGTIYLPLWPLDRLGFPVFQRNHWMIPPPTVLGWAIVIALWALFYWTLSRFLVRFLRRRPPAPAARPG